MLSEQLKSLGFSKNESAVYLALFNLGQCRAGDIIKHTKIGRNSVYVALNELACRKHVLKVNVRGVAEFVVNDPESLLSEIDDRRHKTELAVARLNKMLHTPSRHVTVTYGDRALYDTFYSMLSELKANDVYYVFGASTGIEMQEDSNFFKKFHRDRIKKGVVAKMLVSSNSLHDFKQFFSQCGDSELKISHVKQITPQTVQLFQINLFSSKVSMILYGKEPVAFFFKRPDIYNDLKSRFEAVWESGI